MAHGQSPECGVLGLDLANFVQNVTGNRKPTSDMQVHRYGCSWRRGRGAMRRGPRH